jgi:phosphate transport system substrate-binding protein
MYFTFSLRATAVAAFVGGLMLATSAVAQPRDQIRAVGSSTVFPFATAAAEQFGRAGQFRTPVVESTGTGGGMRLFCAGVGPQHPDIANASRPMTAIEFDTCVKNGVRSITEVEIGYDGIVAAVRRGTPKFTLTREQMWMALAREVPKDGQWVKNPYQNWSDINAALPSLPIEVIGPPPTSGTRDAFNELLMSGGCASVPAVKAIRASAERQKKCQEIREDGKFIEGGENDNIIVQRIAAERPGLVGVFGYSFLDQNPDKIEGIPIDGIVPSYENIQTGKYPLSRSLFIYVNNAHVGTIPGIREYVAELTSERAMGENGYLQTRGLIVEPAAKRQKAREDAVNLKPMGRPS